MQLSNKTRAQHSLSPVCSHTSATHESFPVAIAKREGKESLKIDSPYHPSIQNIYPFSIHHCETRYAFNGIQTLFNCLPQPQSMSSLMNCISPASSLNFPTITLFSKDLAFPLQTSKSICQSRPR